METITDPEQIRAVWEAGDMGEESLGGDSESGTYNRSNRPPAGPRPDVDNPWALLPDDHPKRPKQCGGCGTKWVDAETARACERRHGDDITTPAPVGAAVALDLDAIEARVNAATPGPWWVEQVGDFGDKSAVIECVRWRGYLNTLHLGEDTPTAEFIAHAREDVPALVAEVRRLTEENTIIDRACVRRLDQSIAWMERAESAEAEVVTLRARLAAVEAELAELRHWTRRDRPRLIAATALAFSRPMILGDFDIRASDLRAALATTGEDQ